MQCLLYDVSCYNYTECLNHVSDEHIDQVIDSLNLAWKICI